MDASLAVLTAAVPRVLRGRGTSAVELDVAGRQLFVLAAARWTRYPAAQLARWIGRDPTGVRRLLKAGEAQGEESAALDENRRQFVISRERRTGPMSTSELRAMALTLADVRLRAEVGSSR